MTSYTPKTYASGDTLPATDMTALNAAVGSLATESVAVVPRARIGSGTPAAGMYGVRRMDEHLPGPPDP